MNLREKYHQVIQTAANLGMNGAPDVRDGRLHLTGTVASDAEKHAIEDALNGVPGWQTEVVLDIRIQPRPDVDAPVSSMKTHTVQPGETLRSIAERYLGRPEEHTRIIGANRDQLADSDTVRPGQILKIPAMERQLR